MRIGEKMSLLSLCAGVFIFIFFMEDLSDDSLRSALISQSGDIYDLYDVQNFLSNRDFSKPIGQRFLTWLIRLGVIPAARSEWVPKIQQKYKNYKELCQRFFKNDFDQPLNSLSQEAAHSINVDILRTHSWFLTIASELSLTESDLPGCDVIATRILSCIGLDDPELSYTQGHDRYVWVTLLVAIIFSKKGNLSFSFAEAMSFYLTKGFLKINPISSDIENFPKIEAHFHVLDDLVESEVPRTSELLKSVGHSSMHYALKWELTLFADEHNAHELMFMWDRILLHIDDMTDYVRCLCIAHIRQVPCPEMPDEMAQAIQRNRVWDVPKLIDDSEQMLMDMRGGISFIEKASMLFYEYCGNCYWPF